MRELLSFPNPVNEKAARLVAGTVAVVSAVALATGWHWLLYVLAYGFVARVLTGPTLSPLGRASMWAARRFLGAPRYVAGPPKRFAQGIGATCTVVGALGVALGWDVVAIVVLAIMVAFATLESVFALCVGCRIFAVLMRAGIIPTEVCAECADISRRYGRATA